jgi:hypothetical protein
MSTRTSAERAEWAEPTICRPPISGARTEAGSVSTFAVAPGSTSTNDGGPLSSAMKDPVGTVTVSPRPFGRAKCQAPRRIRCASTRSPLSRSPVVRPVNDPP